MSVTVNDFRKHTEEKAAEAAAKAPVAPLLAQAESPMATTGNDELDKFVRALQAVIDELEKQMAQFAKEGMLAVPADMVRLSQMKYMHTFGKLDALKEAIKIPAQIVLESRPSGLRSV